MTSSVWVDILVSHGILAVIGFCAAWFGFKRWIRAQQESGFDKYEAYFVSISLVLLSFAGFLFVYLSMIALTIYYFWPEYVKVRPGPYFSIIGIPYQPLFTAIAIVLGAITTVLVLKLSLRSVEKKLQKGLRT